MMLTCMAIPDVKILVVRLFTVCFNVSADGTDVCGSRGGKFAGIGSV